MKTLLIPLLVLILFSFACEKEEPNMEEQKLDSLEDGLVAFYPLDGNVQNEVDGPSGELINGAQFTEDRKGNIGRALLLDGIDDYARIPHDSKVNFNNNQEFSVSVWVKLDSQKYTPNSSNDILSKWTSEENSSANGYPFVLRTYNSSSAEDGKLIWGRYSTNAGQDCENGSAIISQSRLNDDIFHHIVIQKNSNQLYLYVDGMLEGTETDLSGAGAFDCETQNTSPLLIGARSPWEGTHSDWHKYLTGTVDDLRIYNRFLTEEEIEFLYAN